MFLNQNEHDTLIRTWDIDVWVVEKLGKSMNFEYNLSKVRGEWIPMGDDISTHKYLSFKKKWSKLAG